MDNIKISSLDNLNRKTRNFLLEHCISKKNFPVRALYFSGYINGMPYENISIERSSKGWFIPNTQETVLTINGFVEGWVILSNNF